MIENIDSSNEAARTTVPVIKQADYKSEVFSFTLQSELLLIRMIHFT